MRVVALLSLGVLSACAQTSVTPSATPSPSGVAVLATDTPAPSPSSPVPTVPTASPEPSPTSGCGERRTIASLTLAFCTFGPPEGISRREAIAIARTHLPAKGKLISADVLHSSNLVPKIEQAEWLWVVSFRGRFPTACPSARLTCPDHRSAVVVLDHENGDYISTAYN